MGTISYYCIIFLLSAIIFSMGLSCTSQVNPNEDQGAGQGNRIDLVEFEPGNDWKVLTTFDADLSHLPEYRSLHFFNPYNGIAITSGSVHHTTDSGKTWKKVKGFVDKALATVTFFADNSGWIVGAADGRPLVLRTETRGLSEAEWKKIEFARGYEDRFLDRMTIVLDVCSTPDGEIWLAGEGGVIGSVLKNGRLEPFTSYHVDGRMQSLACDDSGGIWSVGLNGLILRYKDGWQRIEIDNQNALVKVRLDQDAVWVLGTFWPKDYSVPSHSFLFRSASSDIMWHDKTPRGSRGLEDFWVLNRHIILVGEGGSIITSHDDGMSWSHFQAPTVNRLKTIFALDPSNIWASGGGLTILKKSP